MLQYKDCMDPMYPVGSIVYIPAPTQTQFVSELGAYGFVYEAYECDGHNIYAVLIMKSMSHYDMKQFKPSTEMLSANVCCQHLDETRLRHSHHELGETTPSTVDKNRPMAELP
jgi:hypothetical protein